MTAGPTHEPIDDVRYISNRSSGRLGIALCDQAVRRGWNATLLLGPSAVAPADSLVTVRRFRTTADLRALLGAELGLCDVLIMAAAVADYRPVPASGKLRRTARKLVLELEPTPDLLAECSARRRPDQVLVGFALEPEDGLEESAHRKLAAKGCDLIVANPLETLESEHIRAVLIAPDGSVRGAPLPVSKAEFAGILLDEVARLRALKHARVEAPAGHAP